MSRRATTRPAPERSAWRGRGWLGAGVALALALAPAACDQPPPRGVCQVAGELGGGGFAAHDCRFEDGCAGGWRFAAGTVETMIFCPAEGRTVTAVTASDPRVMVVTEPVAGAPGQVLFDVAAGAAGPVTLEVRGPDVAGAPEVIERVTLEVEDIAVLDAAGPARVVVGGRAAVTSRKRGGSGAPLFGRGGYGLTLPVGLTARPATTATQDCELLQPDVVVTGDAVGTYAVATDQPGLPWAATIEVVAEATVTSARLTATRIAGSTAAGFAASVRVVGLAADGRPVDGVACDWTSSRPAFIVGNVCWSTVLLSTDEPIELTCGFHGRELGRIRLSNAIVL